MCRRRPWIGLATLLALAGCSMQLPSPVDELRKATWGHADDTASDAPAPVGVPTGTPDAPPPVTPVATTPVEPKPVPALPSQPTKSEDKTQRARQPFRLPLPESDTQPLVRPRSNEPRLKIGQGTLHLPEAGGSPVLVAPQAVSSGDSSEAARLSIPGAASLNTDTTSSPRLGLLDTVLPAPANDTPSGLAISRRSTSPTSPARSLEFSLDRADSSQADDSSQSLRTVVPPVDPISGSGSTVAPTLPDVGGLSLVANANQSGAQNLGVTEAKPIPGIAELASPSVPISKRHQPKANGPSDPLAIAVEPATVAARSGEARAPLLSPSAGVFASVGSPSVVPVKPGAALVATTGTPNTVTVQVPSSAPVTSATPSRESVRSDSLTQASVESLEETAQREAERKAREAERREHGSSLTRWLRDHFPFFF